jgi:hypothetical protein
MSLKYVNRTYGTSYEKGMRVVADGRPGIIVGTRGAALKIHIDTEKKPGIYHPVWNIEIVESVEKPVPKKRKKTNAK